MVIFTNNHELISNNYGEHSEISDHDYIVCETSHEVCIKMHEPTESVDTNLSSYIYVKADWVALKAKLREINWSDILQKCTTSEGKKKVILEKVSKAVDEHCIKK